MIQHLHYRTNTKQYTHQIIQAIEQTLHCSVPSSLSNFIQRKLRYLSVRKAINRYIAPKYANANYIRHIIRIAYKRVNLKTGEVKRNIQPQVKTISPHTRFLIITPHVINSHPVRFYYVLLHDKGTDFNQWYLFYHMPECKLRPYNPKVIEFLAQKEAKLETRYQVGTWGKDKSWFYIPVAQFSLQDAYYRLIDFTASFSTVWITLRDWLVTHSNF